MQIKAISTNIGKALLVNALFMFIAIIISIYEGYDSAFTPLLISFMVTFITGVFPFIFVRRKPATSLQTGFLTIVLSWLLSFIFGMLPYVLWGGEFTLINAWFESVSGYTTTGSTILTDIEALPKSLLFWRSSTHLIGGLGVIVFILLILPENNQFKLKLTQMELSSLSKEGYRYKTGKTVKVMTSVYFGLIIIESLLLWAADMPFFDAINHSFSTISTGGFSTRNASIMYYDSYVIDMIITVFMMLASMNYGILFVIVAKRSFKHLNHSVTRYYLIATAIISVVVILSLRFHSDCFDWPDAVISGLFQTASYISTTGFGQADNSSWPLLANAMLLFAAIHCGCSGSTAGGIKADRIYISLKYLIGDFKKRLHPSSLFRTKIGNRVIEDSTISSIFLYIVLYIFVLLLSFIIVLACGTEIQEAFSGTLASLGNVGPGIGELGTLGNYSCEPAAAKLVYTADMFIGRIEIFPILIVASMLLKRQR